MAAAAGAAASGAGSGSVAVSATAGRRDIFISYGHGGFAHVARMVSLALLKRGHNVWFDEFNLAGGRAWADEMGNGISRAGKDGLFVFFLDYWGCRRDDQGSNHGFCINEVSKAIENSMPILVIGLSGAISPPALAERNPLTLDISSLIDDGFSLADKPEHHAFKVIQDAHGAGRLADILGVQPPDFGSVSDPTIGMAAYFTYRFEVMQSVGAIVKLAELPELATDAQLIAAAESIGAKTTRVADYKHGGIDHRDWEQIEAGRGGGACQRVFITGDASAGPLMLELLKDLTSEGHVVEFDPERLFNPETEEDYATQAIHWARGSGAEDSKTPEKPTPLSKEQEALSPINGCMLVLMTPDSVRQYPKAAVKNHIMMAKYSRGLDIIPLRVRWCEVPIEICTLQYVDYTTAVVHHKARGTLDIQRSAYNAATTSLKRTLIDGLERCGTSNDADATLAEILQPPSVVARDTELEGREWVLEEIHAWLDDDDAPAVRVYEGGTGSGKSMVAAHLMRESDSLAAMHVASEEDASACTLRRAVLNFAFQLSRRVKMGTQRLLGSNAEPELYSDSRSGAATARTSTLSELARAATPDVLFNQLIALKLGPSVAEATSDADHVGARHASASTDTAAASTAAGASTAAAASTLAPAAPAAAEADTSAIEAYMDEAVPDGVFTPHLAARGATVAQSSTSIAAQTEQVEHGPGHLKHSQSVNFGMMEARRRQLKSSKSRRILVIDGLERLLKDERDETLKQLNAMGKDLKAYCPQIRLLCLSQTGAIGEQPHAAGRTGPVIAGDTPPCLVRPNIEVVSLLGSAGTRRFERAAEDIRAFVQLCLRGRAGLGAAGSPPQLAGAALSAGAVALRTAGRSDSGARGKRASAMAETSLLPHALIDPAAEAICSRSEGNFLYANSVIQLIRSGKLDLTSVPVGDIPALLPRGMETVYERLWSQFNAELPAAGPLRERAHDLLAVVCACQQPVPFGRIAANMLRLRVSEERERLVASIQPMFNVVGNEGLLQPFHQGLVHWLADKVDVLRGHEMFVRWGHSVLEKAVSRLREETSAGRAPIDIDVVPPTDADSREQLGRLIADRPGGKYFLLHLLHHARVLQSHDGISETASRQAAEILDRERCQGRVAYTFEVARLRQIGFVNMNHGRITSRPPSTSQVVARLRPNQPGTEEGDYLIRMASIGNIAISRVTVKAGATTQSITSYIIYRLDNGCVTNLDPKKTDPTGTRKTWADEVGLIATLQLMGTLVRLREPPSDTS